MSIDQILGLITGILFGFLLQKGRVLRFDKQVGAMLLKDMTIFKSTVLAWKDFGKIGVAEVLSISPWLIIPVFWAGIVWMFLWFERKSL